MTEVSLDLLKGLWDPSAPEGSKSERVFVDERREGCLRWPDELFLVSTHGEVVRGRCKATNLCEWCARLGAMENTEMLALDACEGDAPRVWMVLTTRVVSTAMSLFYASIKALMKAIRRRWPEAEYASLLEFTTGYGALSGGKRRPHWNVLLKGVGPEDIPELRELVADVWCPRVSGELQAQHVGTVSEAGGLMRYIALHFQKESQRPPATFSGQRFNCSRGYFTDRTRAEMRELARDSLACKRQLRRVERDYQEELDQLELEHGPEARAEAAERMVDNQYACEGLPEWGLFSIGQRRVAPGCPTAGAHPVPVTMRAAARAWSCATTDDEVRELEYDTELAARANGWKPGITPWLQRRLWDRRRRAEDRDRIWRDVRNRTPRHVLAVEGKLDRIRKE